MKGAFYLIGIAGLILALSGCYTIPRHYVTQEIIVYYPDPIPQPDPEPWPDPTYPPRPNPPANNPPATNPPRDRQPEKPKDSYGNRDPLQGGIHRGSGEINTVPPVRSPERKDKGRQ